jgi:serine/threonine protein kinase
MQLGRWELIRKLGEGGQGVAHLAFDTEKLDMEKLLDDVNRAMGEVNAIVSSLGQKRARVLHLLGLVETYIRRESPDHCAVVKVLHPHVLNERKALQRLQIELEVVKRLGHASLISVVDARPNEGWFVTPYYGGGALSSRLQRLAGRPVAALEVFRSLVDGVAVLHGVGVVHRDIKPENIFVSQGGLVLGDFGIAYLDDSGKSRVSDTYENVGSRDWMPGWAMGMRLEDVRPTFDVFSLGKVLWAMVSGRTKMRLWYWDHPDFDLEKQFPGDDAMRWINRLLRGCVVEHERDIGWPDAKAFLPQVDKVLTILRRSGQVIERHKLTRCIVCGSGPYEEIVGEDSPHAALENLGIAYKSVRFRIYRCQSCGNLQFFKMDERPPAWGEF